MLTHSKFRWFLIMRLPMAWVAGLRVKRFDDEFSEVSIPYKYWTKNPFKSIYFAAQSMAAELSTGLFAFQYGQLESPRVSMLVVEMKSAFHKKATGKVVFQCADGLRIKETINLAKSSGEAQTITAKSVGKDATGEVVSEFHITWSFKAKTRD